MDRSLCAVLAAIAIGCGEPYTDNVHIGGEKYDYSSDSTGGGSDGSAPEITGLSVVLDENPGTGFILELTVSYTDADDDVVSATAGEAGGTIEITVTEDGTELDPLQAEVGGSEAPVDADSGDIITVVTNIDDQSSYDVSVVLIDMAGNESAAASGSYTP